MSKSAFFNKPDSSIPGNVSLQSVAEGSAVKVSHLPTTVWPDTTIGRTVRFPSSRKFLWDRTPLGRAEVMEPKDLVTSVNVPSDLHLSLRPGDAAVATFSCLDARRLRIQLQSADSQRAEDSVVVPVVFSDTASGVPAEQAQELLAAVQHSLDRRGCTRLTTGLTLAVALRTAGHGGSCDASSGGGGSLATLTATLLLPAASLTLTPLYGKRLCDMPLAQSLSREQGPGSGVQTGYLTMDQARSLLPLAADDNNVYSVPLVGVWVRGTRSADHPLVYATALRFAYSSALPDRATQPDGAFLLLLFTGDSPVARCYEARFSDADAVQETNAAVTVSSGAGGLRLLPYVVKAELVGQTSSPLELKPMLDMQAAAASGSHLVLRAPASPAPPATQALVQPAVLPVTAAQRSTHVAGTLEGLAGSCSAAYGKYDMYGMLQLRGSGSKLMTSPSKAMKILAQGSSSGLAAGACAPGPFGTPAGCLQSGVQGAGSLCGGVAPQGDTLYGAVPQRDSPPVPRCSAVPTPFRPTLGHPESVPAIGDGGCSSFNGFAPPRDPRLQNRSNTGSASAVSSEVPIPVGSIRTNRLSDARAIAGGSEATCPHPVRAYAAASPGSGLEQWSESAAGVMGTPFGPLGLRLAPFAASPGLPRDVACHQQRGPGRFQPVASTQAGDPSLGAARPGGSLAMSDQFRVATYGAGALPSAFPTAGQHNPGGVASAQCTHLGASVAPQQRAPASTTEPSCSNNLVREAPHNVESQRPSAGASAGAPNTGTCAALAAMRSAASAAASQSLDTWLPRCQGASYGSPPRRWSNGDCGGDEASARPGAQALTVAPRCYSVTELGTSEPQCDAQGRGWGSGQGVTQQTGGSHGARGLRAADQQYQSPSEGQCAHSFGQGCVPQLGGGHGVASPHETASGGRPDLHDQQQLERMRDPGDHKHGGLRPGVQHPVAQQQEQQQHRNCVTVKTPTMDLSGQSSQASMGQRGSEGEDDLPSDPVLLRQEVLSLRRQVADLKDQLARMAALHQSPSSREDCLPATVPPSGSSDHCAPDPPVAASSQAPGLQAQQGLSDWGRELQQQQKHHGQGDRMESAALEHAGAHTTPAGREPGVPDVADTVSYTSTTERWVDEQQQMLRIGLGSQPNQMEGPRSDSHPVHAPSIASSFPSMGPSQLLQPIRGIQQLSQRTPAPLAAAAIPPASTTTTATIDALADSTPADAITAQHEEVTASQPSVAVSTGGRSDHMSVSAASDRGSVWSMASLRSSVLSCQSSRALSLPDPDVANASLLHNGGVRVGSDGACAGPTIGLSSCAGSDHAGGLQARPVPTSQPPSDNPNRLAQPQPSSLAGTADSSVRGAYGQGTAGAAVWPPVSAPPHAMYRRPGSAGGGRERRARGGGGRRRRTQGTSSDRSDSDSGASRTSDSDDDVDVRPPASLTATAAAVAAGNALWSDQHDTGKSVAGRQSTSRTLGVPSPTSAVAQRRTSTLLSAGSVVRTKYIPLIEDSDSSDSESELLLMQKYGIHV